MSMHGGSYLLSFPATSNCCNCSIVPFTSCGAHPICVVKTSCPDASVVMLPPSFPWPGWAAGLATATLADAHSRHLLMPTWDSSCRSAAVSCHLVVMCPGLTSSRAGQGCCPGDSSTLKLAASSQGTLPLLLCTRLFFWHVAWLRSALLNMASHR